MSEPDPSLPSEKAPSETTSAPDELIGKLVGGKYLVQARAGRGGMARIYRAEQQPLGRTIALKVLVAPRNAEENDPLFHRRFFQEAATIAKLKHPNTVTLFDYGHETALGFYYMVMEFVEGRTLHDLIRSEGALPPPRALRITHEIARSLQEAHQLGIVHRDLKPSNIMLVQTVEGEQVKVLDFGIAKVLEHDAENLTMDDRIVGSPRYMSPEQIRHHAVDPRSDLYSLGILTFEMMAGTTPFGSEKTLDTLIAHLNDPVPTLASRSPFEIPPALEAFLQSLLAKDREKRPADVAALRTTLRAVTSELSDLPTDSGALEGPAVSGSRRKDPSVEAQPTLTRSGVSAEAPTRDRTPMVAGLVGFVVALLVLGGIGAWWTSTAEPPAPVVEAPRPVEPVPVVAAPAPRPMKVSVTSEPSGAEVWQGTTLRGVTPIDLTLGPEDPPLELELRKAGFKSQPVSRAWAPEDAVLPVALVALPAAPPPKRPPARPEPKKPAPGDMDIVNTR